MADWDNFEEIDGKAVAERFKQRRDEIGMTQVSLAKLARVSQQSICAIERGAIKLPRALPRIADVLGTTARYLITGIEAEGAPLLNVINRKALEEKLLAIAESRLGAGYKYLEPTSKNEHAFAIVSVDEAMAPMISNGDILLVDRKRRIRPRDHVLIGVDTDLLVRKVKMQTQEEIEYVPASDDYPVIKSPDVMFGVIFEIRKQF